VSEGVLLVLGASGHGKVVADVAECSGWTDIRFYDDRVAELSDANYPWPVVGDAEAFLRDSVSSSGVFVAIGVNAIRRKFVERLIQCKAPLKSLVHPAAVVSRYAILGQGALVMPGAVVNAGCVLGAAAIINTGASVDHDCHLGDFVHVCPGAHLAADILSGDEVWFGIGCAVRQGIQIGSRTVIGAGAALVENIGDDHVVKGVPAR
jgi:sugar O-acyltransferase (sialic acid O-acetyltransferase NeuD family)